MTSSASSYVADANAIVAAARWVEHSLLGTAATVIAIIAVAAIGFSTLFGHVSVKRAATVILGCFVLFAAPTIASALQRLAGSDNAAAPEQIAMPIEPPLQREAPAPPYYDPYAGPSVPRQ